MISNIKIFLNGMKFNRETFEKPLLDFLKSEITSDYVLLGVPFHFNAGDTMIYEAEKEILSKINHKCLFASTISDFKSHKIPSDAIILFNGGGSYGDVWPTFTALIEKVLIDYPYNKIIVLPQSVYFGNSLNLKKNNEALAKHKNKMILCCRDEQSFNIAKKLKNTIPLLLPDMVLSMDIDKWVKKYEINLSNNGTLYLHRNDKELKNKIPSNVKYDKISDWAHLGGIYSAEEVMKKAISLVAPYDKIYSDRLHGGILSLMLGKDAYFIDNSYKKTSSLYNTWLKDIDNAHLC